MILSILIMVSALFAILSMFCIARLAMLHSTGAARFFEKFALNLMELERDPDCPEAALQFLHLIAANARSFRVAHALGKRFSDRAKGRPVPKSEDNPELDAAFDSMTPEQLGKFYETINLYLASMSFRDPINGRYIRDALLGPYRDAALKTGAADLAHDVPHFGGMAHA